MSVEKYLIEGLALSVSDSNIWGSIKAFAHEVEDDSLTHEQKKALILSKVESAGIFLIEEIVDLLIVLAINIVRQKYA